MKPHDREEVLLYKAEVEPTGNARVRVARGVYYASATYAEVAGEQDSHAKPFTDEWAMFDDGHGHGWRLTGRNSSATIEELVHGAAGWRTSWEEALADLKRCLAEKRRYHVDVLGRIDDDISRAAELRVPDFVATKSAELAKKARRR